MRILASIFAADRTAKRTTFGFSPPDSSEITLVTDPTTCAVADTALYSALVKMGGKIAAPPVRYELYLYRVGNLYAVTDVDQSNGKSDLVFAPTFFVFDPKWHYLGYRIN